MNLHLRKFALLFYAVFLLVFILSGCARNRMAPPIPEITAEQLIDSLIAQDTLIETLHISGKGKFRSGDREERFVVYMIARRPDKLNVRLVGPLGISIGVLWLCGDDSLCIFIPSKNTVLVEPLGADAADVILPPSAPVMLDMFCALAPIYRFSDSLQNFERSTDGYYLTFKKGGEVLVALAKPNPWRVEEYEWVKLSNTNEQVAVKFSDGTLVNGVWRPRRVQITAPALGQVITLKINKEELNIEIQDSMFSPTLPPMVNWQSAF